MFASLLSLTILKEKNLLSDALIFFPFVLRVALVEKVQYNGFNFLSANLRGYPPL